MTMRRYGLVNELMTGVLMIVFGVMLLYQALSSQRNWILPLIGCPCFVSLGISGMLSAAQFIKIDENAIVYKSIWKTTRVEWHKINAYVLHEQRFVALDTTHSEILLDINNLHAAHGKFGWPNQELDQFFERLREKLIETGALRESIRSAKDDWGIEIKR